MSQTPVSEGRVKLPVTKVPLRDRVFLLGPPGIGKTEIIRQKAEEEARKLGKIFVDLREELSTMNEERIADIFRNPEKYYVYYRVIATHVFPEDLGIPRENRLNTSELVMEFVKHIPPLVLSILSIPGIHGVLFIDEIVNLQRDDQVAMYYSIIQEKEAGFVLKFSKNIKIVLAGNPPEWSKITRELAEPLQNRICQIEVLPPSVDEWLAYMDRTYNDEWEKACAVYLKMFPAELLNPQKQAFEGFPTPRSWTNACRDLYELRKEGADEDVLEAVAVGWLGHEVGLKFSRIFKVGADLDRVLGEIATRPEVFEELGIETKILVLSSIASQTYENVVKYRKFMEYLLDKHRELLTVLVTTMNKDTKARLLKEQWFNDGIRRLASEIGPYVKPRKK
jgi:MoxR-like ATPase